MKIVLDTNILLVSVSRRSPLNWIFQLLIDEAFTLCVTTDILLEYEEKIEEHMGKEFAEEAMDLILSLPNLERAEKFFFWNILQNDPDDNKFVDCAIAVGADYLVSEDKAFKILENVDFPKVNWLNLEGFASLWPGSES
jgi:putative PIN family toxin of toxin-antitoxin system